MKSLSKRALKFLESKEREKIDLTEEEISDVFRNNKIEATPELIDFELNFGGYIFYSGKEPLRFGLINGGGYPFNTKLATVEYDLSDDNNYHFSCCKTNCQIDLTLDSRGLFYEDYEVKNSSFYKTIEEFAICEEAFNSGMNIVFHNMKLKEVVCPDKESGFELIRSASDDICKWYETDNMFLCIRDGHLTLLGRDDSELSNEVDSITADDMW
ncbi:MAG: hypothetical protein N4A72_18440 [Bacteroidales bacterium]|jgi:hypothetical protein|nr:hypothetical protein [Bacteroidales bacterium]